MIRKLGIRARSSSEARQLRDLVRTSMDYEFYVSSYPELAHLDPQQAADHFLDTGWSEGRQPCEWFDTSFYVSAYPEVVSSGQNPFLHYLIYGRAEGRQPFRADGGSFPTAPREAIDVFGNPAHPQLKQSSGTAPVVDFVTGAPEFATWGQCEAMSTPEDLAASMDFGYTRNPKTIESPIAVVVAETDSEETVRRCVGLALRLTTERVFVLGSVGSAEVSEDPRVTVADLDPTMHPIAQLGGLVGIDEARSVVVMAASVDPSLNSLSVLVDTLSRTGSALVGVPIYSSDQMSATGSSSPTSPANRMLREVDTVDERFFCVSSLAIDAAREAADFATALEAIHRTGQRPMLQGTVFGLDETPSVNAEPEHADAGRHVLVVDAEWPTPDRDAGSLYTVNIVRLLLEAGHRVSFASDGLTTDLSQASYLQSIGVNCVYPHGEEDHTSRFDQLSAPDIVFAFRYAVAREHHHDMRLRWPEAKFVFHSLDLHGLRQLREAEELNSQSARNAAKRVVADELLLFEEFDASTVVSTYELGFVNERIRSGEVRLLAIPVDLPAQRASFRGTANVCFIGSFRHPPNVDAVRYLMNEVMPLIRSQRADAVLHIVGQDLPADLHPTSDDVVYHGFVPDLDGFLASMDVSVAALRYGAGIKGKVLSSLAAGLPVVGTPVAFEGMGVENRKHALVGESARDLADAAVEVVSNRDVWDGLAIEGFALVEQSFSMGAVRSQLNESMRAAGFHASEMAS